MSQLGPVRTFRTFEKSGMNHHLDPARHLTAAPVTTVRFARPAAKRELLAGHPLFSGLAPEDLDRLSGYSRIVHSEKGTTIFSKGDPGSGLMAVVSGSVKISVPSPDGKEVALNIIQPGEVFGEIALLDGRPRTANACAMQDSELLILERREFIPFLRQSPEIGLTLLAVLCDRLRRTSEQVEDVLFLDVSGRLAKTILRLSTHENEGRRHVRATQKEIGQMIGLSRESTNKQLQTWVRCKWIAIEKGGLTIKNTRALEKFAVENL